MIMDPNVGMGNGNISRASANFNALKALNNMIHPEWVVERIKDESGYSTAHNVHVISTDIETRDKKLKLLAKLNCPVEFTKPGKKPKHVRRVQPGQWIFTRLDNQPEQHKPAIFHGGLEMIQLIGAESRDKIIDLWQNTVVLLHEHEIKFQDAPDWRPSAEVRRWNGFGYNCFPSTAKTKNGTGKGAFTGNRKGSGAFTSGYTAITHHHRVGVQASSTSKHDKDNLGRADYAALVNFHTSQLAVALFEAFAPETYRQREHNRAENLNTPRCGSWENVYSSTMQYNMSQMGTDLAVELGDAGRLHVDPNDDPASLTLMINLSPPMSGKVHHGRFWLAEHGCYVDVKPWSFLFFSGRLLHRGFLPSFKDPSHVPLSTDIRSMCVCYPNGKIMNRTMPLLSKGFDHHGASPWSYAKPAAGTPDNQANFLMRELVRNFVAQAKDVGEGIQIEPKDPATIYSAILDQFHYCSLDLPAGPQELHPWRVQPGAHEEESLVRQRLISQCQAFSGTGSRSWSNTLKAINSGRSRMIASQSLLNPSTDGGGKGKAKRKASEAMLSDDQEEDVMPGLDEDPSSSKSTQRQRKNL